MKKEVYERLMEESRARQERLRQQKREKKERQRKADEHRRKQMQRQLEIQRKEDEERKEKERYRQAREIDMRGFFGDGELYTKEELMNIEETHPEETGRIRWQVWNRLISEFQHMLK